MAFVLLPLMGIASSNSEGVWLFSNKITVYNKMLIDSQKKVTDSESTIIKIGECTELIML